MPLTTSTIGVSRISRFAILQVKLWYHCAKLLKTNRVRQQAAALSYYTLFGIIPLAIVVLMIFQLSPSYADLGNKVKNFIYDQVHFSEFKTEETAGQGQTKTIVLTEHLDSLLTRFFSSTRTGAVTIFSIISIILAAVSLLSTIEGAFNNIWHISKSRSFLHQLINYWAILSLGPLLLAAGIYVTTNFWYIGKIKETVSSTFTPAIFSFLIAAAAFFLLYVLMPNTKVKLIPALWGSLAAAAIWLAAKGIFDYVVFSFKMYSSIYGLLALIPIMVMWIYITWMIVLFGLQLVYTTQNLHSLDAAEIASAKKTDEYFIANDFAVINVVREVTSAFEKNNAPIEQNEISSRLNMAPELCDKILNHLTAKGILAKTTDPKAGFLPARDPANIKLSDITDAVASISVQPTDKSAVIQQIVQSQKELLSRYNVRQLAGES